MSRQYILGIDPGKKNGIAVYDRTSKKLTELKTLSFWDTVEELEMWLDDCGLQNFEVFIEDVEAISPTYKRGVNQRAHDKISQNVGSNKTYCQLLKQKMEKLGIKFTPISPRGRTMAKMDAETFQRYTGWSESSSQHARDAGALVWQR
jgi:hypothetical protein